MVRWGVWTLALWSLVLRARLRRRDPGYEPVGPRCRDRLVDCRFAARQHGAAVALQRPAQAGGVVISADFAQPRGLADLPEWPKLYSVICTYIPFPRT